MTDPTPTTGAPDTPHDASHDEDEHHPRGTMAITLLFLAGTAAVWIWTFSMLISRSGS